MGTPTRAAAAAPGRSRPRTRPWGPDAVASAAVLSVVVVSALWLHNRGLQSLTGSASDVITSWGRLTGLVASDLLLLQCLLMARIPWAERAWGQDTLARWHRLLGFTSFNLVLVHVGLITVGYAAGDSHGVLGEAWSLVTTYPGMLLATAALGLLVLVTVTSIRRARRRLRYESWHLLHLYAYLGVGLALPHQVWTGTDFVGSAAARVYWWSLWSAAAAAVLVFRVGVPLWRSWRYRLQVQDVRQEAPGVVSVHLRGRRLERLPLRAGQFLTLRFLDGPGWSRGNPYSLSAAPHPTMLRVTAQAVGDGSARLASLPPGTPVLIEGPYGRLTADARTDTRRGSLLLASGVGVTPLRALLEELDGDVTLVYRARTEVDVLFRGELDLLHRVRGVRVHYLLGPRARPGSWLPQRWAAVGDAEALRRLDPEVAEREVYVCGPNGWTDAVIAAARAARVPSERIHVERFTW